MKFPKRTLGYAVAFTAGTLLSGSVAFAASNYIQAQKAKTSVQYHGATVSNPPGLVYGGSMYVQLYSIQQALKQAGFTAGWDGSTFALNENSTAKLSRGTSDVQQTWNDLEYTYLTAQSIELDFTVALRQPNATVQSIATVLDRNISIVNDNIAAIQKDTPTDAKLVSIQSEFVSTLKEISNYYNDVETGKNVDAEYAQLGKDMQKAISDLDAYPLPDPSWSSSTPSAARFNGAHTPANFSQLFSK